MSLATRQEAKVTTFFLTALGIGGFVGGCVRVFSTMRLTGGALAALVLGGIILLLDVVHLGLED
jgi:hypothetical protein